MSTQSNNKEEKKKNENGNEHVNGNDDEGQKPVNVRIEYDVYHGFKAMAHKKFQDKNLDRLLRHLYEQELKRTGEVDNEVTGEVIDEEIEETGASTDT